MLLRFPLIFYCIKSIVECVSIQRIKEHRSPIHIRSQTVEPVNNPSYKDQYENYRAKRSIEIIPIELIELEIMDMDDTSEVSTEPNIYMNSGYKWNNDNFEYQPTASPKSYKDNSEENQNYPPVSFYEQQQPPYENNSFYNPHSYHHSSQSPSHDRNNYPPSPNINKYDYQPTLLESHHDKYQHDLATWPRPYIKYYYYHSPHYHDKNFEYPMPSLEENNLHSHKFYDRDNKANQLTSIKDESIEIDYLPSSREAAIDIRSIKASDID